MTNGKKVMFLETCPTGTNAKTTIANQAARQRPQVPAGFFPYDSCIDLKNADARREFFGEKKEDKKPLAKEHEFMPGVF